MGCLQWATGEYREVALRLARSWDLFQSTGTAKWLEMDIGLEDAETDATSSVGPDETAILLRQGLPTDTVNLGSSSIPAMMTALASEQGNDVDVQRSVPRIFGLDDNTAAYPFVDLWGIPMDPSRG
jgi:hypothetical protein